MLRQWQELTIQFSRSLTQIERAFIGGLTGLTGPLKNLSAAFAGLVGDTLKSKDFGKIVNALSGDLDALDKGLKSGTVKTDLAAFEKDVHEIVTGLGTLGKFFAGFPGWIAKHPELAKIAGFTAIGGKLGGLPGAVVGGAIGAGAAVGPGGSVYDATPGSRAAAWNAYLRQWQRNHALGRDKRSFTQMKADFDRGWAREHPGTPHPVAPHPGTLHPVTPAPSAPPPGSYAPQAAPPRGSMMARLQTYYRYLRSKGLSSWQAAAIAGNIQAESAGDPSQIGDSGTSGGLLQWHASRFAAMMKAVPNWRVNWQGQLDFGLAEERKIDPGFFGAEGPGLAGRFEQRFERPKSLADMAQRERNAAAARAAAAVHPVAIHRRAPRTPAITIDNKAGSSIVVSASMIG